MAFLVILGGSFSLLHYMKQRGRSLKPVLETTGQELGSTMQLLFIQFLFQGSKNFSAQKVNASQDLPNTYQNLFSPFTFKWYFPTKTIIAFNYSSLKVPLSNDLINQLYFNEAYRLTWSWWEFILVGRCILSLCILRSYCAWKQRDGPDCIAQARRDASFHSDVRQSLTLVICS